MFDLYLVATIGIAAVLVLIDLFVISKNSKAIINRYFFIAVLLLTGWIVANYFSNNQKINHTAVLVANHLVFFTALLMVYYLARFVALLSRIRLIEKHSSVLTFINISIALMTLTPLMITGVTKQQSVYAVQFGSLAFLYFLMIVINILAIAFSFFHGLRKSTGADLRRIQVVFWSLVTTIALILATNVIAPLATGSFTLTNAGPLFSIIFVWGVAYSIVRHKLFDIRAVVARSVAYLLLFSTLTVLFVVSVFGITNLFFQKDHLSSGVSITFTLLAIILAFALQPLKRFFDRITNRMFYRDAYDPQTLLNELNRSLVTTIDLDQLLTKSAKIIADTIKAQYCTFAIRDVVEGSDVLRIIGTKKNFETLDGKRLNDALLQRKDRIVSADEITSESGEVKKLLTSLDANVIIKLQGTVQGKVQHPGFIIIGPKQSGNIYSSQDLRLLSIIADELVIAIQNSLRFEEIQQFNITLQHKIDDATRQLRHANSRLRELDATKDEFISMASHQLRTPLTSIKGYLSMVLEGDAGRVPKKEKDMIQTAFDSAERMVFLIADLLNVSRLQSGKFVIENKPADLAKMVSAMVNQLQESAKNHHLKLSYKAPDKFPMLNIDETKIQQVVMNFMDNAIYYTPAGGSIAVALEATDSEIRYTVTDTGLGVPKAEQHHLFSKFYRAGNARKMRPDGTGLGLFMAKKVIAAQGGAIIFKSEEGKGSTFGFSFPRSQVELKGNAPKSKELQTVS